MIRMIPLFVVCIATVALAALPTPPAPPGKLVDLGGHKLHVYCTGHGRPTVVVENGLGDFSFDWTLVQSRVSPFTRICTYDRGGYGWSDPGPKPRTFAQLNLELHDALAKLGEQGPFVLVGHSYGGPVLRNFARVYPSEVAGMVIVDAAHEGLRVGIGGGKNDPPWRRRERQTYSDTARGDECFGQADHPRGRRASAVQDPRFDV
jgi:pimeloyl-ACP methyl ester carboxylesterase